MTPARCSQRIDPESHPMETSTTPQAHAGLGAVRSQDRRAGHRLGLRQARSADADQESGDVRARDRHGADHGHPDPRPRHRRREHRLRVPDHPLAVVHGAVRQFRRSHRRRPRQGAGRYAAPPAHRDAGQAADRAGDRKRLQARARHRASRSATSCWSKPATSSRPTAR